MTAEPRVTPLRTRAARRAIVAPDLGRYLDRSKVDLMVTDQVQAVQVRVRRGLVDTFSFVVPVAALLLREQCTVTVCHSRTRDLAAVTREADLLIAAVGRAALLGADHVKPGAVVVDVGIHRVSDADEVERLYPGDEARRRTFEEKGSIVVGEEAVAKDEAEKLKEQLEGAGATVEVK